MSNGISSSLPTTPLFKDALLVCCRWLARTEALQCVLLSQVNQLKFSVNVSAVFCRGGFWCEAFFFSSCRARSRLRRSSKRLVVGQLFSGCKRTGEMQKAGCLPIAKTKQTPKHKHKPNTKRKKTSRKLSETLRFQNDEILGALNTSSQRHSDSRKKKMAQVAHSINKW